MILIKNAYIKTMAGDDIQNGAILIGDDGKLAAISTELNALDGDEVIDAEG